MVANPLLLKPTIISWENLNRVIGITEKRVDVLWCKPYFGISKFYRSSLMRTLGLLFGRGFSSRKVYLAAARWNGEQYFWVDTSSFTVPIESVHYLFNSSIKNVGAVSVIYLTLFTALCSWPVSTRVDAAQGRLGSGHSGNLESVHL